MSKIKVITEDDAKTIEIGLKNKFEKDTNTKNIDMMISFGMIAPDMNPPIIQIDIDITTQNIKSMIFGDSFKNKKRIFNIKIGDFKEKEDENGLKPIQLQFIHEDNNASHIFKVIKEYLLENISNKTIPQKSTVKGEYQKLESYLTVIGKKNDSKKNSKEIVEEFFLNYLE